MFTKFDTSNKLVLMQFQNVVMHIYHKGALVKLRHNTSTPDCRVFCMTTGSIVQRMSRKEMPLVYSSPKNPYEHAT